MTSLLSANNYSLNRQLKIQEIEMTLKAAGHHNLNSYLKISDDTDLVLENSDFSIDGWNERGAFPWVIRDLNDFAFEYRSFLAIDQLKKIQKAVSLLDAAEKLSQLSGNDFVNQISKSISQLQVQERVIIPLPFSDHMIFFELECTHELRGKKIVDLKIINSGVGIRKNHSQVVDKVYGLIVKALPIDEVDKNFWKSFFGECDLSKEFCEQQFYALLKKHFRNQIKTNFLYPHKIQNIGICVVKCVNFWFSDFLEDKKLYELIKLYRTARLVNNLEVVYLNRCNLKNLGKNSSESSRKYVSLKEILSMSYLALGKRTYKVLTRLSPVDPFHSLVEKVKVVLEKGAESHALSAYKVIEESGQKSAFLHLLPYLTPKTQGSILKKEMLSGEFYMVKLLLKEGRIWQRDMELALLATVRNVDKPRKIFRYLLSKITLTSSIRNQALDIALDKKDFIVARFLLENGEVDDDKKERALKLSAKHRSGIKLLKKVILMGRFDIAVLNQALRVAINRSNIAGIKILQASRISKCEEILE